MYARSDILECTFLFFSSARGFPFFPSHIVDVVKDYNVIPDPVWDAQPGSTEETSGNHDPAWLVRFYDKSGGTFAWCDAGALDRLGEDDGELEPRVDSLFCREKSC